MEQLVIGGVFLFSAVIFIVTAVLYWRSEKKFRRDCVRCKAIVVDYVVQDYSRWQTPRVALEGEGRRLAYRCKSRRMNSEVCPRGTQVTVDYSVKKFLGMDFMTSASSTLPVCSRTCKDGHYNAWRDDAYSLIISAALIAAGIRG